jgi:hypothetical protein
MTETDIQRRIQLALSTEHSRIWRNSVGQGWQGRVVSRSMTRITLEHYRPIHFGLAPGSSDLIGPTSILITPEMIGAGRRIAVFTGIEVKTTTGRLTDEQLRFIEMVRSLGGIADVARSAEEAIEIVTQFTPR